jgi:hypothetical protein
VGVLVKLEMCCGPKYPKLGGEELGVVFAEEMGEVVELRECADAVDEALVEEEWRLRKEPKGAWKERLGRR